MKISQLRDFNGLRTYAFYTEYLNLINPNHNNLIYVYFKFIVRYIKISCNVSKVKNGKKGKKRNEIRKLASLSNDGGRSEAGQ